MSHRRNRNSTTKEDYDERQGTSCTAEDEDIETIRRPQSLGPDLG